MSGCDRREFSRGGRGWARHKAVAAAALVVGILLPGGARSQPSAPPPSLPVATVPDPALAGAATPRRVDFRDAVASDEARELAQWAVHSRDHGHFPFLIVDKVGAQVFVFDNGGVLRGATPALLGVAVGDDSVPGIGQRKLSSILPHERTTPAGRFMAYLDRDIHGEEVLWIDYDTAFSLHRMPKGHPRERRAERMASPTPADNRITYGCINVSVSFYERVVSPLLHKTQAVVYVLPETRPARVVFGSHPVEDAQPPQPVAGVPPVTAATAPVDAARATGSEGPSLAH